MSYKQLRLTRVATHAGLPAMSESTVMYTQDRGRIVVRDGAAKWREVAYRDDRQIGELVFNHFLLAPSETFPAISAEANVDLAVAHWPDAVALYRAEKTVVPYGSTSSFTVSVSGSVLTGSGTAWTQLVALVTADAIAAGYLNGGQAASFSAYYGGAYQRCINVAGVDYAIAGSSPAGNTITVTGTPASGTQTAIVYTYRVAGSTTTCRLRGIPGFVPVAAGDVDGEVVAGWMRMDRGQGHYHATTQGPSTGGLLWGPDSGIQTYQQGTKTSGGSAYLAFDPAADANGNGTPRTGKTTDPRTIGMHAYIHLGRYVA